MVYYDQQPDEEDKPPGCLDVLLITRAVFGILAWPIVGMFVVVLDLGVTFYLYATRPVLALIPIAITAVAIWAFMAWERRRFPPPDP